MKIIDTHFYSVRVYRVGRAWSQLVPASGAWTRGREGGWSSGGRTPRGSSLHYIHINESRHAL